MIEEQFWKEGFLQKAGKHVIQVRKIWRKRWFILTSDFLKYYEPGAQYNDSNLLGTIPLGEIQSVVSTKAPKFAFDVITKSRTYNFSAKSEFERDDWMITLQKAADDKRGIDLSQKQSTASLYSYQSIDSNIMPSNTDYSFSFSDKEKLKKSSKKKSKSLKSVSSESEYADVPQERENDYEKLRASTLNSLASEKETESKPRASSVADSYTRANSMLRKFSVDSENVENIYQELDQELDKTTDDDDTETDDDSSSGDLQAILPPPKNGCETYAFHEMRKLLDMEELLKADLKQVAKQNKLAYNEAEEFLAFSLLKSYVAA